MKSLAINTSQAATSTTILEQRNTKSHKARLHGPDVLRGLAAVGVIFFHVLYLSGMPYDTTAKIITGRFDFFVRIFFILSAFAMMYSYANTLNKGGSLSVFYIKRFFRIAPLFYFMILLRYIIGFAEGQHLPPTEYLLLNVSFLFSLIPGLEGSMVGGGWSIGIEMLFYALFPTFCAIAKSIRATLLLIFLFIAVSIATTNYYQSFMGGELRKFGLLNLLAHCQYFLTGILVYHVWRHRVILKNRRKISTATLLITLATTVSFLNLAKNIPEEIYLSALGFLLVWCSIHGFSKIFENRITKHIGIISYSIYLVQFPVIQFLSQNGTYKVIHSQLSNPTSAFFISGLITIFIVIIISHFTHKYIEVPGQKCSKLFIKDKAGAP